MSAEVKWLCAMKAAAVSKMNLEQEESLKASKERLGFRVSIGAWYDTEGLAWRYKIDQVFEVWAI